MSMKRILGTMLATRMAGRGRRRGALGTASALGLLGSRRRGLGGKLGLAALGYMAYRAYQDSRAQQADRPGGQGATAGGRPSATAGGGGLIDKLRDTANEFLGTGSASSSRQAGMASSATPDDGPGEQDLRDGEAAAERFSEDDALLLIRAMITAAYADGALSQQERGRIMQAIQDADATPSERQTMEREIANPKPLDELLAQVNDPETAQEFYLASRAALDGESEADRRYLADLREKLGLSPDDAAEADSIAS